MASKGYTAQRPVIHDGVRFEIGEAIELEERYALPLLEVGAIAARAEPAAGKPGRKPKAAAE